MRILLVFGTRPEAIKFAPLYWEFKKYKKYFDLKVCVTAQHREMLDQVLNFFEIETDYDLNIMKNNQTLFDITSECLKNLQKVYEDFSPDLVFVQGDTTSAFIGALAAFYKKIPVAHLEAGLRSFNKYSPFPEEMNRLLIGRLSDYHFVPTKSARNNLIREGINSNIYKVGNTVIDALFMALKKINRNRQFNSQIKTFFKEKINYSKYRKIILVTGHRRENFGKGFENICQALREIALKYKDFHIVYPVHLNPNVREPVNKILKGVDNIFLLEPLEYPYLIWLLSKSYLVLTDSGGIQEESPSLGKPVLVMRDVTERIEGIESGNALLVGTNKNKIVHAVDLLIKNREIYQKMSKSTNPYGDGKASKRILRIVMKNFPIKKALAKNQKA